MWYSSYLYIIWFIGILGMSSLMDNSNETDSALLLDSSHVTETMIDQTERTHELASYYIYTFSLQPM